MRVLSGPPLPVNALRVSPDGRWVGAVHLTTGPHERSVAFWDLHHGGDDPAHTLDGPYLNLAFAPDGDGVALASADSPLRLFALPGCHPGRAYGGGLNGMVFFSPDGRLVMGSGWSFDAQRLFEYDLATGKAVSDLSLDLARPVRLDFADPWPDLSADGRRFASMGRHPGNTRSGMVACVWDMEAHKLLTRFNTRRNRVESVQFSPDARLLAIVSQQQVVVWDVTTRKRQAVLEPPKGSKFSRKDVGKDADPPFALAAAFGPGGRQLYAAFRELVAVYDVATWALLRTYQWDVGSVMRLAFTPDGLCGVAAGTAGRVVMWDLDG